MYGPFPCPCRKVLIATMSTDGTEPKGSASSSQDEPCYCGCTPGAHMGCPQGCLRHGFHDYIRKSFAPDEDELSRETRDMEPEAPEDGLLSVPHPYGGAATTVSTTTAAP